MNWHSDFKVSILGLKQMLMFRENEKAESLVPNSRDGGYMQLDAASLALTNSIGGNQNEGEQYLSPPGLFYSDVQSPSQSFDIG